MQLVELGDVFRAQSRSEVATWFSAFVCKQREAISIVATSSREDYVARIAPSPIIRSPPCAYVQRCTAHGAVGEWVS